jgi:hypothetical protein
MISVLTAMLFLQFFSVVCHKQSSVSNVKKVRVCLIKKHAKKRYGGEEADLQVFLFWYYMKMSGEIDAVVYTLWRR